MADLPKMDIVDLEDLHAGEQKSGSMIETLVVFTSNTLALGAVGSKLLGPIRPQIERAAKAVAFKAAQGSVLEILAPYGVDIDRLLLVGCGTGEAKGKQRGKKQNQSHLENVETFDAIKAGGVVMGKLGARAATILFELPENAKVSADMAADFTLGLRLRAYKFDHYKSKKPGVDPEEARSVTLAVEDASAVAEALEQREALWRGVNFTRDLVNEPPNVLYPEEFARRLKGLESYGIDVEILEEKQLHKLGMDALLAVGQGSKRPSQVVIMRWNGAKSKHKSKPLAFIGKGVCFDSGGISIKPAASMEDMKGDMAGAAAVAGLMKTLALRKAKVNVIGAVGLVENMPDGGAYRPGDILTSLSGQTIEVINTDAEGRLVLADMLWHVKEKYKPQAMIDLATLTGAILVALGQEMAGLFSNNDELAARLCKAGEDSGEKVWRMPMCKAFDKMIDSKFADMKNTGGRFAGSSTAAHFLHRFVNDTPWAHLDIAGTAMASPNSDTNVSWGSGWGVALLDRLVKNHYESD